MEDLGELDDITKWEPWHDERFSWEQRVNLYRTQLQLREMSRDTAQAAVRFVTHEEAEQGLSALEGAGEETVTMEEKKRLDELEGKIDTYAQDTGRFEATTSEKMAGLKEDVIEIKVDIKELATIVRETYAKVTNGQEDRISALEEAMKKMPDIYLHRNEFNGFSRSIRNELSTLKWIFGIGMTLLVSLAAASMFI